MTTLSEKFICIEILLFTIDCLRSGKVTMAKAIPVYNTLSEMFFKVASQHPNKTALLYKISQNYQTITYNEFLKRVQYVKLGLEQIGIRQGDRAAILSENRPEWAIMDYGIIFAKAIVVPIYATLPPRQVEYILNDSEAKAVFVSNPEQYKKINSIFNNLKNVEFIITLFDEQEDKDIPVISLRNLYKKGEESFLNNTMKTPEDYKKESQKDDICTIIYTSGTVDKPKGVMLTHDNILSNIRAMLAVFTITSADRFLSFLPLSHAFERTAGHFLPLHQGATIAYAQRFETLIDNIREIHPTVMNGVPRFFEKIYRGITQRVENAPTGRRRLFQWGISAGKKCHESNSFLLKYLSKCKFFIAKKFIFKAIYRQLGGCFRFFVSGGASLQKEIGEWFQNIGVPLVEGYGLTETSPVIAVNTLNNIKYGTVGKPLPGFEVKISDDGEILTRGPHVMKGYYKNSGTTAEAIDTEGWFHTGDIGFIDAEGYLSIIDRKKNIIVLSSGKNIAPQPIEEHLQTSSYINRVMILGDGLKYLSALIVPDVHTLELFAQSMKISYGRFSELINNTQVIELIRNEIDRFSTDLADFEKIKRFKLLTEDFKIETGELTPTLKMCRRIIVSHYKDLIESMYMP